MHGVHRNAWYIAYNARVSRDINRNDFWRIMHERVTETRLELMAIQE